MSLTKIYSKWTQIKRVAYSPVVIIFLVLILGGIYLQLISTPQHPSTWTTKQSELLKLFEQFKEDLPSQTNKTHQKQFAYYFLTEHCLPKELLFFHALGNNTNLDVFVNSFKKKCRHNLYSHVTYIYNTTTTWTTGRNMLYHYVKTLKKTYQFHIFSDDDVLLFYTEHMIEYSTRTKIPRGKLSFLKRYLSDSEGFAKGTIELRNGRSAWRAFEEDLLKHSPAFSTTNYIRSEGFETFLAQQYYWKKMCSPGKKMPWITATYFIDTLFIAYHDKALPLLLPYSSMYDHLNWWVSAILQLFRSRAILYKQTISNYRISVINRAHRPYPHKKIPKDILIKYMEKEAPELTGHIDERELDYSSFNWAKYEEVFFQDKSICLSPVKFPVTKFYHIVDTM